MGSLLLELVPSALGLAITPAAIATTILFLGSTRPVVNALAFATPFALVYGAFATIVLVASARSSKPLVGDHTKHVVSLLAGLLLLELALGTWLRGRHAHRGPVRESHLLAGVHSARPPTAFGTGLVEAVLNPNVAILTSGLATIGAADVSEAAQVGGAVFLVAGSLVGLLGPILWYVLRRDSAEQALARSNAWLGQHEHQVNSAVLVVFGVLFTAKGAVGLL